MPRKILYLINPVSGPKRRQTLPGILIKKTNQQNIPFDISHTNANGDYSALQERIKKENITDVVVCGGDGSINKVVYGLIDVPVNIGIIPTGSGNGLAFAARIPRDINKALKLIFEGKASYVDGFFINEKFSCMLCGVGFDAQVAHDFAKQQKRGLSTYIRQTLKNFIKAPAYPFELTIKGKTFATEAFFISIANSNQFGNNFKIARKATLDDGLLDIIIVNKMSKARMVWAILKQIRSGEPGRQEERNFHKKEVMYLQTDKLIIHNHSLAPLHIDGDPAATNKKFTIEILPAAFKLIKPK